MKKIEKNCTFTFIAEFRGGTYCTQVEAETIEESIKLWILKIKEEIGEIKHLGDKTITALEMDLNDTDNKPVLLKGLKNIWYTIASTKKGVFQINIVKTNTQ